MMMAMLLLCAKVIDIYQGGQALSNVLQVGDAQAEEEPEEEQKAENATEEPADANPEENVAEGDAKQEEQATGEEAKEAVAEEGGKNPAEDVKLASLEAQPEKKQEPERPREFTQIELDILQSLSERREELEQRAQEIDLKEKLLEGTELRINDKLEEIKQLKQQVDILLTEYNNHEDKKISGLVKVYETMKPKDAAKIFNELDMPIMLQVVDRMSSRKVAPVLAGMDPERARDLTIELAEYRRLKALPQALNMDEGAASPAMAQ